MIRKLISARSGASAAEFAIVLPLFLLFLFGIIDAGRWIWTYNQAEKATQMGARFAVVTDHIAPGIGTSFIGVGGLTQGDVIPASQFGSIVCTSAGCTCKTAPCPTVGAANSAAFNAVVARMQLFLPTVSAANVAVEYSSSGLGYAGDPYGADLSPLITVSIGKEAGTNRLQFTPITTLLLATMNMPFFTTTLPAEDMTGSQSN
ncbi:MAG TPA: TadE family protein [Sphingomicrobium sp.]|nr:TadE family protein [Sphingomicrobium sp.]